MIERAAPKHAEQLSAIALKAKAYWGYPAAWLEMWADDLTITEDLINEHCVFAEFENGEPAAFYVLCFAEQTAVLEHLWVTPERIGFGTGRRLFEHAAALARSRGAAYIDIESEPHAEGFYAAMRAEKISERAADIDGISRNLPQMRLNLNERRPPDAAAKTTFDHLPRKQ